MRYVLAYDLGTSSIKASVISNDGTVIAENAVEYPTYSHEGGIRVQNPADWERAMVSATQNLSKEFPHLDKIECIGISGHSLGVVAIDQNNQLLVDRTPIWSDGRAEVQANEFFDKVDYENWYNQTGNGFTRHLYSVFKIMWYKQNQPHIYQKAKVFLGTKDWLNLRLCGVACTDRSYASGSGVYILADNNYSQHYIEVAGLSVDDFPTVVDSVKVIGTITDEMSQKLGLPTHVKVVAGGVDNACMSLGAGCISDGDAYVSLGSSAWIATSTSKPTTNFQKKIYTWAHCVPGMYIPSSGIFSAGTSHEWVIKNMFGELSSDIKYKQFNYLAEQAPVLSNDVYFCPVMSGGSYVDVATDMKGGFVNVDLSTSKQSLARATYEGIAFGLKQSLDVIGNVVQIGKDILFVGGGANSDVWMQIFADIFNKNTIKSATCRSAASLGAASLALVGIGAWDNFEPLHNLKTLGTKIANEQNVLLYKKGYEIFRYVCQSHANIYDKIRKSEEKN